MSCFDGPYLIVSCYVARSGVDHGEIPRSIKKWWIFSLTIVLRAQLGIGKALPSPIYPCLDQEVVLADLCPDASTKYPVQARLSDPGVWFRYCMYIADPCHLTPTCDSASVLVSVGHGFGHRRLAVVLPGLHAP